jgi:hypothetical protein
MAESLPLRIIPGKIERGWGWVWDLVETPVLYIGVESGVCYPWNWLKYK